MLIYLCINSATLGIKQSVNNETFGFVASMPLVLQVVMQTLLFLLVLMLMDKLQPSIDSSETNNRELDLGIFYINTLTERNQFTANIELRNNYAGTSDDTVTAGLTYKAILMEKQYKTKRGKLEVIAGPCYGG